MSYTKTDTTLTDILKNQAVVTAHHCPLAVLVMVTWFCVRFLHMLCQMAENEGEGLAGEAGVFPSLLPDNAPSAAWGACATNFLPIVGRKGRANTQRERERETDGEKWADWK